MRPIFPQIAFMLIACLFSVAGISQEAAHEEKKEGEKKSAHHRITFAIMHAHIPALLEDGSRKTFAVPAWAFDYDYWFNEKWGVGLHNDLIIQQFIVEKNGTEIQRNNPVAVSLVGLFRPGKHLAFIGGVGREFEKTESFNLIDLGLEWSWELPNKWELGVTLKYETKIDAYDTWLYGLGVSKIFK